MKTPFPKLLRHWWRWMVWRGRVVILESISIAGLLQWQFILLDCAEEIEYYAIYDPHVLSVLFALMLFKPIEYALEMTLENLRAE